MSTFRNSAATILGVALAASQMTYYEAKVVTFGCTSIGELLRLQALRSDQKAFQMAFLRKQVDGECVTILKGTLVEGVILPENGSILRVNAQVEPPGYEALLEDFQLKQNP